MKWSVFESAEHLFSAETAKFWTRENLALKNFLMTNLMTFGTSLPFVISHNLSSLHDVHI